MIWLCLPPVHFHHYLGLIRILTLNLNSIRSATATGVVSWLAARIGDSTRACNGACFVGPRRDATSRSSAPLSYGHRRRARRGAKTRASDGPAWRAEDAARVLRLFARRRLIGSSRPRRQPRCGKGSTGVALRQTQDRLLSRCRGPHRGCGSKGTGKPRPWMALFGAPRMQRLLHYCARPIFAGERLTW